MEQRTEITQGRGEKQEDVELKTHKLNTPQKQVHCKMNANFTATTGSPLPLPERMFGSWKSYLNYQHQNALNINSSSIQDSARPLALQTHQRVFQYQGESQGRTSSPGQRQPLQPPLIPTQQVLNKSQSGLRNRPEPAACRFKQARNSTCFAVSKEDKTAASTQSKHNRRHKYLNLMLMHQELN